MKDRDERSRGMEILMPETLSKIKTTETLRLTSRVKESKLIRFLRKFIVTSGKVRTLHTFRNSNIETVESHLQRSTTMFLEKL